MKRVTERADLAGKQVPEYISGCRQFEGEDLNYRNRLNMNNAVQKEWVQQQTEEKESIKQSLKEEESMYSEQTESITRMRGLLEDEMTQKKNQQLKELQAYNQRLADEKKAREKAWAENQEDMNQKEIARTNMSDFMTENPVTTTSQLAKHRYVPYHFKGLKPDSIDQINATRAQQVKDNKAINKAEKAEEAAWGVQNLANTQHFLNNEVDLANKQASMTKEHSDQALVDKVAKDERWPNMYGDLNPQPTVEKDMVAGADVRPIK